MEDGLVADNRMGRGRHSDRACAIAGQGLVISAGRKKPTRMGVRLRTKFTIYLKRRRPMLAKEEVGTQGHIKLWLAGKNADEVYTWSDPEKCPAATYAAEFELASRFEVDDLQNLARDAITLRSYGCYQGKYGDLFDLATKTWN
jgi:hypothetical protein